MARIHEIADALALHLGGKHVPANQDGEFFDWYARVEVDMPAPSYSYVLTLTARGYGAKAGQITASLDAPRYKGETIHPRIDWPSASVNGDRDLQSIVADIARRVCNKPEANAALAAHAKALADRDARQRGIEGALAELTRDSSARESCNYPRSSSSAKLFNGNGGTYFTANVSPDSVHFERIGSVSIDQAKRIIAILEEANANG